MSHENPSFLDENPKKMFFQKLPTDPSNGFRSRFERYIHELNMFSGSLSPLKMINRLEHKYGLVQNSVFLEGRVVGVDDSSAELCGLAP